VPPFDFRLPGVTSMSADTHKYGYASKGTSVVLYRGEELRRAQYFTLTDWPGGLYMSPTLPGSRPGALSAACWAAMTSIGEQGYLDAAERILAAAATIRRGIEETDGLRVLGDPLFCIAFATDGEDLAVYRVMDAMSERGWSLNGLHRPPAVHICTTLRHAQPGVAERFVGDLREAVAEVRETPAGEGGMAPVYGMAAQIPDRGVVSDMLAGYMDLWYRL
jgi:glutamate/tyrosine decarboxylase-like PLP-dependent enzyme